MDGRREARIFGLVINGLLRLLPGSLLEPSIMSALLLAGCSSITDPRMRARLPFDRFLFALLGD
jgi:hypothetical protein